MYWFKGESLFSCLAMTGKQLMTLYVESYKVEAREQMRLVLGYRFGNIEVDASDYLESLEKQAYPISVKEDEEIGVEGFKKAFAIFGPVVSSKQEIIEYK